MFYIALFATLIIGYAIFLAAQKLGIIRPRENNNAKLALLPAVLIFPAVVRNAPEWVSTFAVGLIAIFAVVTVVRLFAK